MPHHSWSTTTPGAFASPAGATSTPDKSPVLEGIFTRSVMGTCLCGRLYCGRPRSESAGGLDGRDAPYVRMARVRFEGGSRSPVRERARSDRGADERVGELRPPAA